ncbi:MAG: hypothetical protein ACKOYH_00405 [Cyanobium sp.]
MTLETCGSPVIPDKQDWIDMHKYAWQNAQFKQLLETDPAEALKFWGILNNKQFTSVIAVPEKPENPDEYGDPQPPPACC